MIKLKNIIMPQIEEDLKPVILTDKTMQERKFHVLKRMKEGGYDALFIYADLEHGSNFEYLVGFLPRFEEAILVLSQTGDAYLLLGNENLNKCCTARIHATAIHVPHLSLPNQPMKITSSISDILMDSKINEASSIGLVGWKNFTHLAFEQTLQTELPNFLVEALRNICKASTFHNATNLFIGENGVRTTNNANEVAHYEFGSAIAGNCILEAMSKIEVGKSEIEIAKYLDAYGQTHSVVTIMATAERFEKANMYPTDKIIRKGDKISMSTGFKGGLQSRSGYALHNEKELPSNECEYLERIAIPYFDTVRQWMEKIHINMLGGELYDFIEHIFPKEQYGWSLNPGHLCADEEWMSSPIYPDSKEVLRSGMLFQIDIIPSVKGLGGISCESGILLADENLRHQIKIEYPTMWERIEKRRYYIQHVLGIHISDEILPTSNATALCKPFMLNKNLVFVND